MIELKPYGRCTVIAAARRIAESGTLTRVRLEAKPGCEADLDAFLHAGAALAEAEPETLVWFAVRIAPSTFGIFDAFADEAGRSAHLMGRVAAALGEHASRLLDAPPVLDRLDVLAAKPSN